MQSVQKLSLLSDSLFMLGVYKGEEGCDLDTQVYHLAPPLSTPSTCTQTFPKLTFLYKILLL